MIPKHKLMAGFLLLGSLLTAGPLAAQATGRIAGQVTDAQSGAPLGEVQVFIPGTGVGTLTRSNGRYVILNVPVGAKELRAERIGMGAATQQVTVVADQVVEANFTLSTQALGLDEIVVTGAAGAARRREVGNTISQVNIADIPGRTANVQDMLAGAAPGLNISAGGGEMGNASAIRLRGNHSVSMSNTPIIYIDGIRIRSEATPNTNAVDFRSQRGDNVRVSPFAQINPNDIERIEIIKGSAATTLYGTEASNGVIQIFTKSGSQGAPVWTLETQHGAVWSRKFGKDIDISGTPECQRTGDCNLEYFRWRPYIHTGYNPSANASVRGGGQNLQYYVSGAYDQTEGILPNEHGKKWLTRGNFTFTPATGLQFQWNTGFTHSWAQTVSQSNSQGYGHNVYRGIANFFADDRPETVKQINQYDIQSLIDRLTTGGTVTYSPIADLTNRVTIGYDFIQKDTRNLRPYGWVLKPLGALLNDNWQNTVLTVDYVSTYSFDIASNLRSSFSWGGQAAGTDEYLIEAWGENFPGAAEPTVNSASVRQGFEERKKVWNAGFFFQDVFDITNKYFVTLGMRVDGNSAFGSGFGLQMYPKASLAWVVSDEGFWKKSLGTVKLRTAYGRSGKAPGAFDAVRTWSSTNGSWNNQPAFVPQNVGNPDLGPEVSSEIEAGFDGSWFDDRAKLEFTWYRSTTSDALLNVPQIASQGFNNAQLTNIGQLRNQGIEVNVTTSPILNDNWGLDVGVNLSTNHSEVLDLGPGVQNIGSDIVLGQPVPVVRGRYVTNPDEIADPKIEQNHVYGPGLPTLNVAPNLSLRMPYGITFAARGEYKGGNVIQDSNIEPGAISRSAMEPTCWPYYAEPGASNKLKPLSEIPALYRARCTPALTDSGYFVWDADFFRLKSVSLVLPVDALMPARIKSSTLTLSLNDSFTWKAMPLLDPEIGENNGSEALAQSISPRVPPPIQFNASLRLQF